MGKRLENIATPEADFKYGIETRQVIPDTKNVAGQLWLYVNKHPDNKELIRVLVTLHPQPFVYSQSGLKKRSHTVFGYEFVFDKGSAALNKLKKKGFKLV